MTRFSAAWLSLAMAGLLAAPLPARGDDVRIYAAASLTAAVTKLAEAYEAAGLGAATVVTGSSGALANQIAQGAPADVFLSANREWVTFLVENEAVDADAVVPFAANSLVLIAPADTAIDVGLGGRGALQAALDGKRLVLGDPATAPVGVYARQALDALGLWQTVGPNVVYAQDAVAVLAFVSRDAADAGIVYATDAALGDVRILATLPAGSHEPILYYAAPVVADSEGGATAFLELLQGDRGRDALTDLGFLPPPGAGKASR